MTSLPEIQPIDFSIDLLQAILWQYEHATNLKTLCTKKQKWYEVNHTQFFIDNYSKVFDLWSDDFSDFGATVWSILLKIPLQFGDNLYPSTAQFLQLDVKHNFDNGNLYETGAGLTLDLEDKKFILRFRYYELVMNGAIGTLAPNKENPSPMLGLSDFVSLVFSKYKKYQGQVHVVDNLDMSISYIFSVEPPYIIRQMIEKYDILPRPAGVKIKIVIATNQNLVFDNPYNFDNGAFSKGF